MTEKIPVHCIIVGERQRPIDPQVVADLARSIEQHGLLQPIGVKPVDGTDNYELLFGAHRLEAVKALRREAVPATIFPVTRSADEGRLLELRENLDRNDLSRDQRKAFAAEVDRIIAKLHPDKPVANGNEGWLKFGYGNGHSHEDDVQLVVGVLRVCRIGVDPKAGFRRPARPIFLIG